jgi:hypothetical protein
LGVQRNTMSAEERGGTGGPAGNDAPSPGAGVGLITLPPAPSQAADASAFQFISEKVEVFPIRAMCRVLQVFPAGYYAWRTRPKSERSRDDERLAVEIEAVHEASRGIYGSPRVARELRVNGLPVSTKRVARIMRANGLQGRRRRRYRTTTNSKHSVNVAPNLLERTSPRRVQTKPGSPM